MKPHISIFIPQLLQPLALWKRDFSFTPQSTLLQHYLPKARQRKLAQQNIMTSSWCLAGKKKAVHSIATWRYFTQCGKWPEQPCFCLDPVSLQSGIDNVTLLPPLTDLTRPEANDLVQSLNDFLVDDVLHVEIGNTGHWYLLGEFLPNLNSTPPAALYGENIFAYLPHDDERYWRLLMNELQMLLHLHPVNQRRESRGAAPVNGVWAWGEALSDVAENSVLNTVWGGGVWGQTLATASGAQWQAASHVSLSGLTGHHMLFLETLLLPALADDIQQWQQAILTLEKQLQPFLIATGRGEINISISSGDGVIYQLHQAPRWQFWRFK